MKTAIRISVTALLFILVCGSYATGFKLTDVGNKVTGAVAVPDAVVDQLGALMYTIKLKSCQTDASEADRQSSKAVWEKLLKAVPESGLRAADEKNWQWELSLANDISLVDAEAFPGGKVIVYSGCCGIAGKDASMMAFVLSHEMAHALARHAKARFDKHTKTAIMSAAAGGTLKAGDLDDKTIISVMTAMGVAYETADRVPFANAQELEADRNALILMKTAGYNPNKAIDYLKVMQDTCSKNSGIIKGSALEDHPSIDERIANLNQYIRAALRSPAGPPAG